MKLYEEFKENKINGFYRGIIVEVLDDKNGLYRVRINPFYDGLEDEDLPVAQSNMTNKRKHISLEEDDIVWCFFDCGLPTHPIIFNFCNIKDKYPIQCTGDEPDYYDNIEKDDDIDENEVKYNGEYNSVDGFDFKDIHIEIDMENNQFILISPNWQIIFDKDECGHLKIKDLFIKTESKFNIHAGDNIVKLDDDGLNININNKGTIIADKDGKLNIELKDVCELKTDKELKITTKDKINIDATSSDITIKSTAGKCDIDCLDINLGGSSATNKVFFEGTGLTLSSLLNALITHTHDVPQSPTGTQTATPSNALQVYNGQPSTWYSQKVKTKS